MESKTLSLLETKLTELVELGFILNADNKYKPPLTIYVNGVEFGVSGRVNYVGRGITRGIFTVLYYVNGVKLTQTITVEVTE